MDCANDTSCAPFSTCAVCCALMQPNCM
jgi:hypothetical protein